MFRIRNFWRTKLWVRITVVTVILTLAGYAIWVFVVVPRIMCGSDVKRVDDQCIGVTDGQVPLSPDLKDILDKIKNENDFAGLSPDAVSVAYLIPLPKSPGDELAKLMRHELEGAYIAQLQANHTQALGDKPRIRLLVANSGDESSQRQQVVSDLLAKVGGPEKLVAVVVTGKTKVGTIDAIDSLRRGGVPVVTSRLAGDRLTNLGPAEQTQLKGGLARLAPTGSDEAAAAAAYLRPVASRAVIVRDANSGDPFLGSLDEGFRRAFRGDARAVVNPVEKYDSTLGGAANAMRGILRNICQQKPDVVFFAGRSLGLAAFVQALPSRPCQELRINIMTGGDAVEFANMARVDQQIREGLKANVSVRYATQAHPKSWEFSPASFPPGAKDRFTSTCDQCFNHLFPGEALEDGVAITGYDAIVTTVTALRPGQGKEGINSTPELISQEFYRLHGTDAVPGAGGWISLDDHGTPVNKAVVILEVKPDGTQEFVTLSSPTGSPCVPGTPPC